MTRRKWLALILAAMMALTALAGCAPPASEPSNPTTSEPSTAAPADSNSASADTASDGDDAEVATLAMVSTWDKLMPFDFSGNSGDVIADQLFERLVIMRFDGSFEPRFASTWEQSEDYRELTITVNENATWSDGTPMTAKDIQFTAELITNPKVSAVRRSYFNIFAGTDEAGVATGDLGVKAPDEKTVVFTFKNPMDISVFFNIFNRNFYVLPEHIVKDMDLENLSADPFWQMPTVTGGPYKPTNVVAGDHIELEANKNYYLGAPDIEKLVIRVVQASNILSGLISGNIDIIAGGGSGSVPLEDWENAKSQENLECISIPSYGYQYMAVNQTTVPKQVRQAISLAINRQVIVDALLQGEGKALMVPFPEPHPYYVEHPVEFDVEAAKALVEESGFDTSKTLTLTYGTGNVVRERSAALIQQDLQKIGLTVQLEVVDLPTLLTKLREGQTDFGLIGASGSLDPDEVAGVYVTQSTNNFACIEDTSFEELLAKGASETSFETRKPIYDEWQEKALDECYYIYFYSANSLMAYNSRLSNVDVEAFNNLNWCSWEWEIN